MMHGSEVERMFGIVSSSQTNLKNLSSSVIMFQMMLQFLVVVYPFIHTFPRTFDTNLFISFHPETQAAPIMRMTSPSISFEGELTMAGLPQESSTHAISFHSG